MKILLILLVLLGACTNEPATHSTLRKAGFTNISTCGYSWFACSDDDMYHTCFTATNPNGEEVSGVVCCGAWKNCTIRW